MGWDEASEPDGFEGSEEFEGGKGAAPGGEKVEAEKVESRHNEEFKGSKEFSAERSLHWARRGG